MPKNKSIDPERWYKTEELGDILQRDEINCVRDLRYTDLLHTKGEEVLGESLVKVREEYAPRHVILRELALEVGIPSGILQKVLRKGRFRTHYLENVAKGKRSVYFLRQGKTWSGLVEAVERYYEPIQIERERRAQLKVEKRSVELLNGITPTTVDSLQEQRSLAINGQRLTRIMFLKQRYDDPEYKALIQLYLDVYELVRHELGRRHMMMREKKVLYGMLEMLAEGDIDPEILEGLREKVETEYTVSLSTFGNKEEKRKFNRSSKGGVGDSRRSSSKLCLDDFPDDDPELDDDDDSVFDRAFKDIDKDNEEDEHQGVKPKKRK